MPTNIDVDSTSDVGAALDRVGDYLAADRIRHELVIATLLLDRGSGRPVRAWWAHRAGRVLGVVVQAATHAEVSQVHDDAASPLATAVAEAGDPPLATINGPASDVERIATHYTVASKRPGTPGSATCAMETSGVAYPPEPTGARRLARTDDLDLIVGWLEVFDQETGGNVDRDFNRALATSYIERSQLHLWDTDQGPVASTAVFAPDPDVARLVFVYTPVEYRGHGFASRLVAEVAQAVLDAGSRCILFTDMANPTSTAIYERVGFRPLDVLVQYEFN